MLDDETHEAVLCHYFDYHNPQSLWVDERRFRSDMLASPSVPGSNIRARRTAYYSPLLHNAVLAIGVAYLDLPGDVRDHLGIAFAKRAKDLVDDETEMTMLSTVGGGLLVGTYYASVARHNFGFVHSGIGLRLVQALGLGTNCSYCVANGSISKETMQARHNMFYTAYILDNAGAHMLAGQLPCRC
jgi:hypothetical protein